MRVFTEIDTLRYPAMPDPQDYDKESATVWVWPESQVKAILQKDPANAHGNGYLVFPLCLSVFDHNGRHILTVTFQQTDYRMLAFMTGEKLKDLKGDKKGHLSPITVGIYHYDHYEEIDLFDDEPDYEEMVETLLDLVTDELNLDDDPVETSSELSF
jgi:hypothetical protein